MTEDVTSLSEQLFTERELQQYDGSRGKPAYIAYEGVVYDVTASSLWRGGMHKDLHYAGTDLTRTLRKAPHSAEVFGHATIKRVGRLFNEQ
jgi:predicted heme/steroid binding protein